MAAYKLEDNIREKLEAREIKPTANAWNKLEAKLDAEKPKKKPVLWYYIAASFIGLLILGSVFFNRNVSEVNNELVNETTEQINLENQPEIIPNTSEVEEIVSIENDSEKDKTSKSKEKEKQNSNSNSNMLKTMPQQKSEIDKKINKTEVIAKSSNEEIQKTDGEKVFENQINTKVDEVVASVKKLQETNADVTKAEVEMLLNNAQREIQSQRILNTSKVDATALLQDVEWELEKSFRDKVYDALGEGFRKIRTAVIERNN